VTVEPAHEAPRPQGGEGFSDAVTFSFGDAAADVYAVARVGLSGENSASGLGLVFSGGEPVSVQADGVVEVAERAWESIDAAGLSTTIERPLEAWTLAFASDGATFDLTVEAVSGPGEMAQGGMEGYEQLCRVTGTVAGTPCTGIGQRGHSWGNPDWDKIALTRSVSAWFDDGSGSVLSSVRSVKASSHADEALWAAVFDGSRALTVDEPRLSTTTDSAGRQIRAGLEYWLDKDDDYPTRGVGEVVTGSTLELGALRLDVAFFNWHIEGRTAVGRYDVIRRG
jgi:hypothetical protein